MKTVIKAFVLGSFLLLSGNAVALETKARNVILVDYETGQYLFTKEHQRAVPPASMSKLMTVYMIFSKLRDGSLSLEDTFTVSENAWRKGGAASGGSTMFLNIGEQVKIEDLLKGIIIQSGNDACIVAAENISGSEENFAVAMNEKASTIGLKNSHFSNATGLPHPDHRMSVEDLATLAKALINEFPEFYHLFSERYHTHNGIKQGNRNPLLYSMNYADGLKTGHTEEAGFSLTASAKKGDRRLIAAMTGMASNKERSEEAEKIMSWGFREFDNYVVLKKGQKIATIPVWLGSEKEVDMIVPENVKLMLKKNEASKVKMTAVFNKPVAAPIKKGDKLGIVKIELEDEVIKEVPLVADENVGVLGFLGRMSSNLKYLLVGTE